MPLVLYSAPTFWPLSTSSGNGNLNFSRNSMWLAALCGFTPKTTVFLDFAAAQLSRNSHSCLRQTVVSSPGYQTRTTFLPCSEERLTIEPESSGNVKSGAGEPTGSGAAKSHESMVPG